MKFTLKDYQDDAVRDVLARLRMARRRWHQDSDRQAFSLTATTGAGKTVMAAAVFEALFHGSDNYEFEADPGAIVIWFSDDPSLNEQTRFRIMESSDRLRHTDLVVVDNSFSRGKFEAGRIYFLNTQKLSKKSLLVRGFESDGAGLFSRPDLRSHTIWDTLRNTIEDPALTLYLVLDEAHRGMGDPGGAEAHERSTLVKQLINGEKGVPPIPIVLGISATVERFNKAMEEAEGRTRLPDVKVDSMRVQDSGLLKDTIALDIPEEAGHFDTVLVRRATDKLKELSEEWAAYAKEQESGEAVLPLMVLQVPNKPNHGQLGGALEAIFQTWPELPETCIAHVFGEHTTQSFGRFDVPYISPEHVQDQNWVRILIAKDAISTGWDCPRAEVMVSFRRATDRTHITQLLGRMVRTPLARRVPGNERLNSVDCLLPFFDKKTVNAVVQALMQGTAESPPLGRVLINPKQMKPNPAVTETMWATFEALPSQSRPQRGARAPIRLTALAHELAYDGLLPQAGKWAHLEMHKVLDDFTNDRRAEYDEKRRSVLTVEGRTVLADLRNDQTESRRFQTAADDVVINDAYRHAARAISPDIARTYTEVLASRKEDARDDLEAALVEAREDVAALGMLENLQVTFDAAATELADTWLRQYHDQIKELSDDRQEAYRQITALSTAPQDIDLARPVSRMEATAVREKDGTESKLAMLRDHLVCDDTGEYPAAPNQWETAVLEAEMQRVGFKFWYRNPNRPSQDSLGVAYVDGGETKIVRPDFLFFAESEGEIAVDIVDPHGIHLSDALPKLQGLARYAQAHAKLYRRIASVAEVGGKLRVLDMARKEVREAVLKAEDAKALYSGSVAGDYA